jgi:hypothetical protein
MERALIISTLVIALAGCGEATITPSEPTPTASAVDVATPAQTATPDPTAAAAPSVTESNLPAACFPPPHDAPDLEAALPTKIAGRRLAVESYRGALLVTCVSGGTATDVADLAAALAAEGLSLDDISVADAGRSDLQNDPPYHILAYQMTGQPGNAWPPTTALDNPDAAAFREADIEGKHVLVGETAGVNQSEHVRGRPYVWDSPTVHYLIVTDEEAWAAEVLRSLK